LTRNRSLPQLQICNDDEYSDLFLDELGSVFNIVKPTIMFSSITNYGKLERVLPPSNEIIVFDSDEKLDISRPYIKFSQLTESTKTYTKVKNRPEDVVFILYSSGTTDLPKGVTLMHKNWVFVIRIFL